MSPTFKGYTYGVMAVLLFSPTAPATRHLTGGLSPLMIGSGRICLAGVAAALFLTLRSKPWPETKYLMRLVLVAATTGVIFPLLLSLVMQTMSASTGIGFLATIPLATSLWAAVRFHEKITSRGWAGYVVGVAGLVLLTINDTARQANHSAAAMLIAVICVSFGFAEGGALSREIEPWVVVSWSLILALPVMLLIAFLSWKVSEVRLNIRDLVLWTYLGLVCSFLAYVPWYQSMKLIGITHTTRLQLLQPFCGLALSLMLLQERLTYTVMAAFSLVLGGLLLGDESRAAKRKMAVSG
jgi:drug/metabolite transporter (DMT)-like permease